MWFLNICAIIVAFFMVKYRERLGDMIGDAEWMRYVGGVYNFIIILAVFIFFWSIASLTGTQKVFFFPLYWVVGGAFQ